MKEVYNEPQISNKELLDGYHWNKEGKQIQHLNNVYMVRSVTNTNLTGDECKQYLTNIEEND